MARAEKYHASEENQAPGAKALAAVAANTPPPAPNPTVGLDGGDEDGGPMPMSVADGSKHVIRVPADVRLTVVPASESKYQRQSYIAEGCWVKSGREWRSCRVWVSVSLRISLAEVMKGAKSARDVCIQRDPKADRKSQYTVKVV